MYLAHGNQVFYLHPVEATEELFLTVHPTDDCMKSPKEQAETLVRILNERSVSLDASPWVAMKPIPHRVGDTAIVRFYRETDPIWQLPDEKRQRQMLADVQRDLLIEADRLAQTPVTTRG